MLPWLYQILFSRFEALSLLRLLDYISSRAIFAAMTAFLLCLLFGRRVINLLYRRRVRDEIREYGLISSMEKRGTPTMGGVLIIGAGLIATLLFCKLDNRFVWFTVAASLTMGLVGMADDWLKKKRGSSDAGLSRGAKYLCQFGFGVVFALLIISESTSPLPAELRTRLLFPFFKDRWLELGWLYIPFVMIIFSYAANAVNLADGLDGLAIVPSFFVILVYGVLAYVFGNTIHSQYFLFDYLPGSGELTVLCAGLVGAAMGFLWFNAYPAEVFMGDSGSLYLGGTIGALILLLKQELLFFLVGGIFLVEILSVVIQDWIGIKLLGRRLLFRAPIHHTYQYRGMAETKVVVRFWIVAGLLALIGLASLKIR